MTHAHELPEIGTWYWDKERSERFEIVASDKAGNIEIQYFDGEVAEIDQETWYAMQVVAIAPPKDWSGPYEMEKEDYQELKGRVQHPLESIGHNPLDFLE